MRSPTYDPMSVNSTPSDDMSTYMNAGIAFTVWVWKRRNAFGMATRKGATTGSMNVRPGDINPTSTPAKNHTGMVTSMPADPSKSNTGMTIGSPMTIAAVSTDTITNEMANHAVLNPS